MVSLKKKKIAKNCLLFCFTDTSVKFKFRSNGVPRPAKLTMNKYSKAVADAFSNFERKTVVETKVGPTVNK